MATRTFGILWVIVIGGAGGDVAPTSGSIGLDIETQDALIAAEDVVAERVSVRIGRADRSKASVGLRAHKNVGADLIKVVAEARAHLKR